MTKGYIVQRRNQRQDGTWTDWHTIGKTSALVGTIYTSAGRAQGYNKPGHYNESIRRQLRTVQVTIEETSSHVHYDSHQPEEEDEYNGYTLPDV